MGANSKNLVSLDQLKITPNNSMKMKVSQSLLGFFLVLIASHSQVQAESVVATASKVTGNAYVISPSGKSTKITEGSEIPAGSSIHTDADSTVGLKLVPGATTVVAPNTDLKLSTLDYSQSGGDKTRKIQIALQKGSLFSSLAKHDGKSDFRITTPGGVAAARGTDWEVSYSTGAGLSVSCTDGTVTLTLPGGAKIIIPGGKITTSADGKTTVTGNLSQDQVNSIISTIEAAGFSPANGTTQGSNGAGTYNNNGQSSNPANISAQPTVSGNQ